MKKIILPIICLSLAGVLPVNAEQFHLVRYTDCFRRVALQVMTTEEFGKLNKRIKTESFLKGKAHREATKKWQADEELAGSYPGRSIGNRKAIKQMTFSSQEEADKKLEDIAGRKSSDKEGRTFLKQTTKNNDKNKQQDASVKAWSDKQKRKVEKEKLRALNEAKAYNLYIEILNGYVSEKYPDLGHDLEPVDPKAISEEKTGGCCGCGKKGQKKGGGGC